MAEAEPETPSHLRADPFKPTMAAFAEEASAEVEKLRDQLKAAERGFAVVRHFFGVPKSVADDGMLPLFAAFLDAFKRAVPPPKVEKKPAPAASPSSRAPRARSRRRRRPSPCRRSLARAAPTGGAAPSLG